MAVAVLAKQQGVTVLATTRRPEAAARLHELGVDEVLIDDGEVSEAVRALVPEGVDGAVELVGTNVLRDTLRSVRVGGTVCFTGMLSDVWTIPDFYPLDWLPNGVRLTAYSGDAGDLPTEMLQAYLNAVSAGTAQVPLGRTYPLAEIVQAHHDLDAGRIGGKGVVLTIPGAALTPRRPDQQHLKPNGAPCPTPPRPVTTSPPCQKAPSCAQSPPHRQSSRASRPSGSS
jgi:NADPH:quinone reductase-like Zn-dependent oxidoreductase